jgi:hypothetical protein
MRILSPFKDYYDYVVSQPDNKKVFVRDTKEVVYSEGEYKQSPEKYFLSPVPHNKLYSRLNHNNTESFEGGFVSVLAYCDKLHYFLQYNNLIYWHYEDIPEEVLKKITPRGKWWAWNIEHYEKYSWGKSPLRDVLHYKKISWVVDRKTKEPIKTDLNKTFGTPLVFVRTPNYLNVVLNPKLTDIGFNKVLSPTETYQDIYNWIPYKEPEVPSSPDDMSRYEAKGFDKKTSFRPNMK